jgi:hypothetical protein
MVRHVSATCIHQVSNRPCWDYNFKGLCIRQLCNYKHACLKCGLAHPFAYCTHVVNQSYANTPSSVLTVNYNVVRPIRQDVHRAQQSFWRPPFLIRGPRPVINRFPVIKFPPQYNAYIILFSFRSFNKPFGCMVSCFYSHKYFGV